MSVTIVHCEHHAPVVQMWMVEEGGLPRLLDATRSMDPVLRLNGVWAAQNMAHNADLRIKQEIMKGLPWSEAEALLSDSEVSVKVRRLDMSPHWSDCNVCFARSLPWSEAEALLSDLEASIKVRSLSIRTCVMPGANPGVGQKLC